jgi:asparagine N-glycosylation enzyme membrane subunit Stt3
MTGNTENSVQFDRTRWSLVGWSAALLLLLLPLLAMQLTDQVNWTVGDFAFAAALVVAVGIPIEIALRRAPDRTYLAAVGVALLGALLLLWLSAGVGLIGGDGDPSNLMYLGVVAVGVVGSLIARFKAQGMARTLLAVAVAQALIASIALIGQLGYPHSGPLELAALNGFFFALFLGSAALFWRSARH